MPSLLIPPPFLPSPADTLPFPPQPAKIPFPIACQDKGEKGPFEVYTFQLAKIEIIKEKEATLDL